jgi:phosphodiesterase/alkaline phosphatase D-like protein
MARAGAVVAILLLSGLAAPAAAGLLVTVGEVTATSAVVWTRGAAEGDAAIEYGPASATTRARATLTVRAGNDLTGKLRLDELVPGTRYGYRVQAQGESVGGEFVTAPGPQTAAPVTFLWSGSWSNASVFGLSEEGGAGFAVERDAILDALRARGVKNLVVLAADVHHAEVARHAPFPGFTLHEMIAGPLAARHGRPRPLDEGLNPRTLFARGGVSNFGAITIDIAGLTVRIVDEDGASLFTTTILPQ